MEMVGTNQSCPGFDEPIKSELRCIADGCTDLIIHVLLVKAQLMQHAYLIHKKSNRVVREE